MIEGPNPSPAAQRGNLVAIGGFFLLLVLVLQLKPIDDVDIFWQVKLGQLMIATGELIEQDVFTYTHAGEPTPTIGWLAQVIYAWLYDLGGWRAIQLLHATLFAAAFGIAGLTASNLSNQGRYPVPFTLVVGIYLGLMAGLSNADVRPQSFALLGFAAVLYLTRLGPFSGPGLASIGVIAILWQNTHPSLSLGVLAVGTMAAGGWLTRWRRPNNPTPVFLSLATGILALAQLATPMGWDIFDVSAANVHVARDLLQVSEWLPPWDPSVRPAMTGPDHPLAQFDLVNHRGLAQRLLRQPVTQIFLDEFDIFLCQCHRSLPPYLLRLSGTIMPPPGGTVALGVAREEMDARHPRCGWLPARRQQRAMGSGVGAIWSGSGVNVLLSAAVQRLDCQAHSHCFQNRRQRLEFGITLLGKGPIQGVGIDLRLTSHFQYTAEGFAQGAQCQQQIGFIAILQH